MNVLKFNWLAVLLFIFPVTVLSQTVTLKGVVYAKKGGESLDNVSIYVVELKQSASTDENGTFTIAQVPQGEYTINFVVPGYTKHVEKVIVKGSSHPPLTIYVDDETELEEVTISGETLDKINNVRISVTKVTPKLIKGVPGIGGEPDIATYLQTLPGVVTTGDQGGQLY
ncbi:MAG: carboxypeptidase-like regulatory domain-containing protein, partial [Flavobacteriales bacterium]